jgi:hypothetical protein
MRGPLVLAACAVGALALAALSGCHRPLLSPKDERSPFDRYDAMRDQFAQQYVEDEFGRRQPNLRGRLSPKR